MVQSSPRPEHDRIQSGTVATRGSGLLWSRPAQSGPWPAQDGLGRPVGTCAQALTPVPASRANTDPVPAILGQCHRREHEHGAGQGRRGRSGGGLDDPDPVQDLRRRPAQAAAKPAVVGEIAIPDLDRCTGRELARAGPEPGSASEALAQARGLRSGPGRGQGAAASAHTTDRSREGWRKTSKGQARGRPRSRPRTRRRFWDMTLSLFGVEKPTPPPFRDQAQRDHRRSWNVIRSSLVTRLSTCLTSPR